MKKNIIELKEKHGMLRAQEVLQLLPISRSALYEGVKNGTYPKPVKLGGKMSAWYVRDIVNYIEGLKKCA